MYQVGIDYDPSDGTDQDALVTARDWCWWNIESAAAYAFDEEEGPDGPIAVFTFSSCFDADLFMWRAVSSAILGAGSDAYLGNPRTLGIG